jgi:hypothetical protein
MAWIAIGCRVGVGVNVAVGVCVGAGVALGVGVWVFVGEGGSRVAEGVTGVATADVGALEPADGSSPGRLEQAASRKKAIKTNNTCKRVFCLAFIRSQSSLPANDTEDFAVWMSAIGVCSFEQAHGSFYQRGDCQIHFRSDAEFGQALNFFRELNHGYNLNQVFNS